MTKTDIKNTCLSILDQRIQSLVQEVDDTRESMFEEDKNSAGDKFETGREMMKQELEKLTKQLEDTRQMRGQLARIETTRKHEVVDYGSLITTQLGIFFLSVSLGPVTIGDKKIMLISAASPIGNLLIGKKSGESISLNGRTYQLLAIE
jgi:transcription elongation GreA/GreB family factor